MEIVELKSIIFKMKCREVTPELTKREDLYLRWSNKTTEKRGTKPNVTRRKKLIKIRRKKE